MTTYPLVAGAAPTTIDAAGTSATATITNHSGATVVVDPLGWPVNGSPMTVPLWSGVRTTIRLDGHVDQNSSSGSATGSADVVLAGSAPAAAPYALIVSLVPWGAAGSITLSGSWFTDAALKTAASFPMAMPPGGQAFAFFAATTPAVFTLTTANGSQVITVGGAKILALKLLAGSVQVDGRLV